MASTPNPALRLHLAPGCIRKDEAVEPMITSGRLRKTMKPAQLPSTIVNYTKTSRQQHQPIVIHKRMITHI